MAIETMEMRMTRLERGCERIVERLGLIEHRLTAVEPRLASGMASLRYEVLSALDLLRSEVRAGEAGARTRGTVHFYWLLTLVVGSILVSLLLELVP